ncbi:hypothetical protein FA13DRAFT_1107638 [Coprinellus micaceus]|uniref:Uncharacterized protein n=1 Tax=Coprinellus micaceus TaxID=71717 RepID=A0A4Y7RKS8_COPMI|nr:hypothetical protein FA13DRAFT_1107638 [Coprinellus micaceus]
MVLLPPPIQYTDRTLTADDHFIPLHWEDSQELARPTCTTPSISRPHAPNNDAQTQRHHLRHRGRFPPSTRRSRRQREGFGSVGGTLVASGGIALPFLMRPCAYRRFRQTRRRMTSAYFEGSGPAALGHGSKGSLDLRWFATPRQSGERCWPDMAYPPSTS